MHAKRRWHLTKEDIKLKAMEMRDTKENGTDKLDSMTNEEVLRKSRGRPKQQLINLVREHQARWIGYDA